MIRASAWLALAALAACGSDREPGNAAEESGASAKAVQTATPVGLFESDSPVGTSQICFERAGADYRFGLTLRGTDNLSCSGSGRAALAGDTITLTMEGDEPCVLQARQIGTRLDIVTPAPESCAYYCAPGLSLAGRFEKVGGEPADAARARDLVGDPLCG